MGRFNKSATSFFLSLKWAVPDAENVLSLHVDAGVARSMGLYTQDRNGNTLILIRDHYRVLWENISDNRKLGYADTFHAVVNGTAGIGKSTFRFFLLWKWLNNDLGMDFDDVRINASKAYYIIEKDGAALQISNPSDLLIESNKSLALLDPCELVTDKNTLFSMVIVTASPSSIVGQAGKVQLSEFMKYATVYVMRLWTLVEIEKVIPVYNPDVLEKFSFQDGEETYCVPRWLIYDPKKISGHISSCWTNLSQDAVKNFFFKRNVDHHKCQDLPYRLCSIVENGPNDWKVQGFISEYAASLVYDWAHIAADLTRENFVTLLDHPLGAGLIGNWYERWALECITNQTPVIVSETQLLGVTSCQSRDPKMIEFHFNALETVDIDLPSARRRSGVVKPDVSMITGILYHPKCKVYPSIDAFGISVSGELILLQFTKSLIHSPANWSGISDVVSTTNSSMKVILIYCTPSVNHFRTPNCPTLANCPTGHKVTVCKGSVRSEFLVKLQQSGRSSDR